MVTLQKVTLKALKFTAAPDPHKQHQMDCSRYLSTKRVNLVPKVTQTHLKGEIKQTMSTFPPPLAVCQHESTALNVTRIATVRGKIATVSLLSL